MTACLSERTPAIDSVLHTLPLVTLHLTDRCNSRCISCDYWRHGRTDITVESVERLLPDLARLGTRVVLISGGEPLLHPQWASIAQLLRAHGLQLWLVTAGLSLAKHAARAVQLFESITVSLDGATASMYLAIRGLDAFDKVCEGVRTAVAAGGRVSMRVTVQRANYRSLPALVDLARGLGVYEISFLAADVSSAHAFGRTTAIDHAIALRSEDLGAFAQTLQWLEDKYSAEFASGFIAESPAKLRRILQYYTALCGLGKFPLTRCNAPEFSAVIDTSGHVQPCFFIAGPGDANARNGLERALNGDSMQALRASIRSRRRAECVMCVCSLWRDQAEVDALGAQADCGTRS